MRRLAPRPLGLAVRQLGATLRPASLLAQVQASWPAVAGPLVSAEAEPGSEHDGIVTVRCRSSVWAQELDLLAPELTSRLGAALDPSGEGGGLRGLRFVMATPRSER